MSTHPTPTDQRDRRRGSDRATTPASPAPASDPTGSERREPQPWRTPEDARDWRVIGRGRRTPQPPPLVTVEVELSRAQSDWLRREAERTGLDYPTLIRRLVDDARDAG